MLRLIIILAFSLCTPVFSQNDSAKSPAAKSVRDLTVEARKSLFTVSHGSRGTTREGTGTGFAISNDLIATCLHVIGEARAIKVQTWDGKELTVLAVHASDRKRDLAILKIKDGDLTPLPLGDSAKLLQGESVIALGNPMGLTVAWWKASSPHAVKWSWAKCSNSPFPWNQATAVAPSLTAKAVCTVL